MATTSGYDPKKAAIFNQLRQDGLSEEAAATQAGIPLGDGNYVLSGKYNADGTKNPNPGAMGPIVSSDKVAGVDYDIPTAAETAESNRFYNQAPYQVTADSTPSKVTPVKYTSTSTETVSGGGQTTTTAGLRTPNVASEAIQPKIDEKQVEINQFVKDNPTNFIRKKEGLPLLSESEQAAQDAKFKQLTDERAALRNEQNDAKTPGTPTITTVPNTTTTTTTVTSGTTSVDTAVAAPGGSDPVINQQTETNLGVAVGASNVRSTPGDVENNASASTTQTATVTDPPPPPENSTPAVQLANDYPPLSVTPGPLPTWYTDPNATGPVETATRSLTPAPEPVPPGPVSASETGIPIGNQTIDTITPGTGTDAVASVNVSNKVATLAKAKEQATVANQRRNPNNGDWRVKLRLAPGANYLYNATDPGILKPLKDIGIIFPYTPTIQTTYKANYSSYDLTHSNYKGYYYQGSAVEPVTLSCPFTAQSTVEAEYLLAVIHFFKSVTKMFYGQDAERGTPPPLVYLTGLGEFQFNEHPCVVQSFTYDLPADIDYIRARSPNVNNSNMLNQRQSNNPKGPGTSIGGGILGSILGGAINRLAAAGLPKGGMTKQPAPATFGLNSPTYVPTKMTMHISLLPVQSRKQQSQQFSLKQYANGDLLKGGFW